MKTHEEILLGVEKIFRKGKLRIHEREPSWEHPDVYFYRCNNDIIENISFRVTILPYKNDILARIEELWRKDRIR